jgi:branched-chain amino acid transport system substrate-binding protein
MSRNAWVILISMVLLVFLVPACGGGDSNTIYTPTATIEVTLTGTPTATSTASPTPAPTQSTGPVKIGGITSWSGAASMSGISLADPIIKVVEKQVKDEGGILGGRDVKVIRYDNRASVSEAVAGCEKLLTADKVSAITFGGVSGAESDVMSTFAEKNKILYVTFGHFEVSDSPKYYTLSATLDYDQLVGAGVDLANKVLHPKTAAFIAVDLADGRRRVPLYKEGLEAAGTKTVYEQYVPMDVVDMSSYVTQIRSKAPDLLIVDSGTSEFFLNTMQAFQEQGGWGDIKVIALPQAEQAKARAGAQGVYVTSMWIPGLTYPGAIKYEHDYAQANDGKMPSASQVYYYNGLWTVIEAIKLAGTDTDLEKIANLARFSGKLEWDSPMGHAHYTAESNGYPQLKAIMTQIVDKKLVAVPIPE